MISWLIITFCGYIVLGASTQTISPVWPSIASNLNADITFIGIIMGIYLAMNVFTSPLTSIAISKVGVKHNIAIGVLLLGASSICFSLTINIPFCIFAIILLGIGAAIVDTTSNYYVALKYKPRHLTWLHCMWAIGSTLGTYFMATLMKNNISYKTGFQVIGLVCVILGLIILIYKSLEKKHVEVSNNNSNEEKKKKPKVDFIQILRMKYVLLFLGCMFFLDFLPNIFAVWYSSYATTIQNRTLAFSTFVVTVFFIGQVTARIVSGFIVEKLGTWKLVLLSITIVLAAAALLFMFNNIDSITFFAVYLLGFGISPLYPLFMDIAKKIFGEEQLRGVIGLSGSCAKTGGFIASVFVGGLISIFSLNCIFAVLLIGSIVAVMLFNLLNYLTKNVNVASR